MTEHANGWIFEPIMQYGFAGMSAALIAVIVWLIKRLLGVLSDTNTVISANSNAIANLADATSRRERQLEELCIELFKRPCLSHDEKK